MATSQAKNTPVTRTTAQIDTDNEFLGRESVVMAGDIGRGDPEEIHIAQDMSEADHASFMEDVLEIIITGSGGDDELPTVPVGVNGNFIYLPRYQQIQVRRKYVEALARAKRTDFHQNLDFARGEEVNRLRQSHTLKYPVQVIHDPNPVRGTEWLRAVLAQPR